MNPNRSTEETILDQALSFASAEARLAYLQGACGGDKQLRARVQALIDAREAAGGVLADTTTVGMPTVPTAPQLDEGPGTVIGHYKLLQKIGEGGFGAVYMAEQTEPVRRRVALKVIKLGMDTRQVIARFEAERQALALMDHPNIAKVLDAGATATGRPYFVMELVKGIRITDYCDQNNLSTNERLGLFMQVCHAIQHAHQKGIIHRDIKPSNILVTLHDGVPVPKVIDFGIAKATTDQRLTDKTLFTAFEQLLGTPAYMSPEQAEMSGLDIDTRSDIYSLGVLLYELLAGSTPFDAKELLASGIDAMRKTIREKEPVRPSTRFATLTDEELTTTAKHRSTDTAKLLHQLRGDLDWIVMKALEKDRTRRYETTNGLAQDIQRHLNNELVAACPPSVAYRLQKAVRRHRFAFAAAGAITLALILGLVATSWQAARATRAERRQTELRASAEQAAREAVKASREAVAAKTQAEEARRVAEETAERRRQESYAAEMRAAQVALQSGNLGQCRQLLLKYQPKPGDAPSRDLRGLEWRYLWQQSRSQAIEESRAGSGVLSAAVSPDGRFLAAFESAGRLVIWDAATKQQVHEAWASAKEITRDYRGVLAFSADSTLLAHCCSNGVRILSVGNWRTLNQLPGDFHTLAFSPDGTNLVAAGYGSIAVWHRRPATPDETAWEVRFQIQRLDDFNAIAYPTGGSKVFVGCMDEGIHVLDLESGQLTGVAVEFFGLRSLTASPDGRFLAAGNWEGYVAVWNLPDLRQIVLQRVSPSYVRGLAYSSDSRLLATGGNDQKLKLWSAPTEAALASPQPLAPCGEMVGHERYITSLSFAAGKLLSSSMDHTARIWPQPAAKGWLREFRPPLGESLVSECPQGLSRDGSRFWMVTTNSSIAAWDLQKGGDPVAVVPLPSDLGQPRNVADLNELCLHAFWHHGEFFYQTRDGMARRYDPDTRETTSLFHLPGTNVEFLCVLTNAGRTYLLIDTADPASKTFQLRAWDLHSGKPAAGRFGEYQAKAGSMGDFSWASQSPDGAWIAEGEPDYAISLWDAFAERRTIRVKVDSPVRHMAFSPDSRLLAAGCDDSSARVWDVRTGTLKMAKPGEDYTMLWRVQFSADGKTLLVINSDGQTQMHSVVSGLEMLVLSEGRLMDGLTDKLIEKGLLFWIGNAQNGHPAYLPLPSIQEIDAENAASFPK